MDEIPLLQGNYGKMGWEEKWAYVAVTKVFVVFDRQTRYLLWCTIWLFV